MTDIKWEYVEPSKFPPVRRMTRWTSIVDAYLQCPKNRNFALEVPADLRPRSIKYALKQHFRNRKLPEPEIAYSKDEGKIYIRPRKPVQ